MYLLGRPEFTAGHFDGHSLFVAIVAQLSINCLLPLERSLEIPGPAVRDQISLSQFAERVGRWLRALVVSGQRLL